MLHLSLGTERQRGIVTAIEVSASSESERRGARRTVIAAAPPQVRSLIMKSKERKSNDEPIGIVIAGILNAPSATVFSAFEWGPAPAIEDEPKAP